MSSKEHCQFCYHSALDGGPCVDHEVLFPDSPLLPRAIYSLPNKLQFKLSSTSTTLDEKPVGVMAKVCIPAHTTFGPLVGVASKNAQGQRFAVECPANEWWNVLLEDDDYCNWMKYVRMADQPGQNNLVAFRRNNQIFFSSINSIPEGEELVVYYSTVYSLEMQQLISFAIPKQTHQHLQQRIPRNLRNLDRCRSSSPEVPLDNPTSISTNYEVCSRFGVEKNIVTAQSTRLSSVATSLECQDFPFPVANYLEKDWCENVFSSSAVPMEKQPSDSYVNEGNDVDGNFAEALEFPILDQSDEVKDLLSGSFANFVDEMVAQVAATDDNLALSDYVASCVRNIRPIPLPSDSEMQSEEEKDRSISGILPTDGKSGAREEKQFQMKRDWSRKGAVILPVHELEEPEIAPALLFKRKRGRPRKSDGVFSSPGNESEQTEMSSGLHCERNRHRLRKLATVEYLAVEDYQGGKVSTNSSLKKKRSRPRRSEQSMLISGSESLQLLSDGCVVTEARKINPSGKSRVYEEEDDEDFLPDISSSEDESESEKKSSKRSSAAKLESTGPKVHKGVQFRHRCSECEEVYYNQEMLNIHKVAHGAEMPTLHANVPHCPSCKALLSCQEELVKHVSLHKCPCKPKIIHPYSCDGCSIRFKTEKGLENHKKAGHARALVSHKPCRICKKMLTKAYMKRHIVEVHGKDWNDYSALKYSCPWCTMEFSSARGKRNHVICHMKESVYSCPRCPKTCSTYEMMNKHLYRKHFTGVLVCKTCGFEFTTRALLSEHLKTHSTQHMLTCDFCGQKFKYPLSLKNHLKLLHNPDKPNEQAKRKVKVYDGVNNPRSAADYQAFFYKCVSCKLGFLTKKTLLRHLKAKHPNQSLKEIPELNLPLTPIDQIKCPLCKRFYWTEAGFDKHVSRKHEGAEVKWEGDGEMHVNGQAVQKEKVFVHWCVSCDMKFNSAARLVTHRNYWHKDTDHVGQDASSAY